MSVISEIDVTENFDKKQKKVFTIVGEKDILKKYYIIPSDN